MAIAVGTTLEKPFINRKEELDFLEGLYYKTETQAQFFVLYGKRRVGKTELIKHFYKDKPHIYYLASKGSARDQLRTLTEIIVAYFNESYLGRDAFPDWRSLFDYLGDKLRQSRERLIFVVDEFPYLVESDKALSSYFQYGWNEQLEKTNVLFVLMGSSIGMMYKHVLEGSAPLYGRKTGQLLLDPFSFTESRRFYQTQDFERLLSFYAIAGGMPAYLKEFDDTKNVVENIQQKVLKKNSFLYQEPELLLAEDFDEPRNYLTILKAIGIGQTRFAELLNITGLDSNELPIYLKTLIDLRLVKKEVPVTEPIPEKSKKGTYSLSDNFLRFFYSYVFPNISLVEGGGESVLLEKNEPLLTRLIAKTYEECTDEFIRSAIKENALPPFYQMGRWWDNKDTEIDMVGLNETENSILFVETKWNTKPIGTEVLNGLKQKAEKVEWRRTTRKEHYALVAKGGFTDQLREQAKNENVLLIQEDKVLTTQT